MQSWWWVSHVLYSIIIYHHHHHRNTTAWFQFILLDHSTHRVVSERRWYEEWRRRDHRIILFWAQADLTAAQMEWANSSGFVNSGDHHLRLKWNTEMLTILLHCFLIAINCIIRSTTILRWWNCSGSISYPFSFCFHCWTRFK